MKHQPEAAASYLFVEIDQPSDDHHGVPGQLESGGREEGEVEVSTPGRTLASLQFGQTQLGPPVGSQDGVGGSCDGVLGDPIPSTP